LETCRQSNIHGCVATYSHEKFVLNETSPYSFIEVNKEKIALRLEEKTAISNLALCGIHYWKSGSDFIRSSEKMLKANDRINNEFYVSRTYNYLIKEGKNITYHPLEKSEFVSLGTPRDVERFKNDH
jgi:dTDP-glucose pyrophosphorylase